MTLITKQDLINATKERKLFLIKDFYKDFPSWKDIDNLYDDVKGSGTLNYNSFGTMVIENDPRIFMIGGVVLVSYGLYTIFYQKTKKIVTDQELVVVESNNYLGLFFKGFFLNTINFGVLAFWLAIVIAVSSNFQMDSGRVFKYFALAIFVFLLTDLGKILAAKQLKAKLTPVVLRKIRHALGIFFIVFGIILATKRYIPEKTMDKIDNVIDKVRP